MNGTTDRFDRAAELEGYDAGNPLAPGLVGVMVGSLTLIAAILGHWPGWAAVLATVAGVGLGYVGVIDFRTRIILDRYSVILGVAGLAGAVAAWAATGDWVHSAFALGSGVFAFLFFLVLAARGDLGSGDLKIVVGPSMLLGAWIPLVAMVWLTGVFMYSVVAGLVLQRKTGSAAGTPMVPLMAAALPVAVFFSGQFMASAGLGG